jgi:DNA-binding transcriptional ArsR family regulator
MTSESNMSQSLVLKKTDLTAVSLLFEALSNESRVSILNLLRKGPMSVGEISDVLGLEQTAVSHNLKCLAFCGLATFEKEGKMRVYELNRETVEPMLRLAERHISKYAENLRGCSSLER